MKGRSLLLATAGLMVATFTLEGQARAQGSDQFGGPSQAK